METAYEAVYIIDTGLPEEQVNAIVEKYTGVVTRGGGVVDDIDRWEPRRLAYEVKGKREGAHICMNFRSEPPARDELDRIFRISDDVLRFLVIKQDERADRFPSKARAAEQERRDREMAARAAAAAATAAASAAVGPAAGAAAGASNGGEPVTQLLAAPETLPADAGGPDAAAEEPADTVEEPADTVGAVDAAAEPVTGEAAPAADPTADGGGDAADGGTDAAAPA
jgi:small subunit ribosomal protein S6